MQARPRIAPVADDRALVRRVMRWSELFAAWPENRRIELLPSARLRRYKRRTLVLSHDSDRQELLAVASGCVEVSSVSAEGRKHVNSLLGPGRLAPLVRLLEDVPLSYDYHAYEDSVIIHLPSDAVVAVLDAEPILWREVTRLALQRQRHSILMLQALTLGSIRQRVVATLRALIVTSGIRQQDAQGLRLRLTQQELAAMLGVSRQTINRELGRLAEAGLIAMRYKHLLIRDQEGLELINDEDGPAMDDPQG